jgi:hypothetical protein
VRFSAGDRNQVYAMSADIANDQVVGVPGRRMGAELASAPAVPGSCSVGLQDNGEGLDRRGHLVASACRGRQIAVSGDILFQA